jgi:hypothetical protein
VTEATKNCWGCVHRVSRIRGSTPRSWCGKYHTFASVRCIDYQFKPKAVERALRFVKRMAAR